MRDADFPYVKFESSQSQLLSEERCTRCSICNKVFYVPTSEEWVYKMENKHRLLRLLCSWSCFRKAEVLRAKRPKRKL